MYKLNDGQQIPDFGFGTYKLNGRKGVQSIVSAINNGYRMIDTAYNYENEGTVGKAIAESGINRDKLTVTLLNCQVVIMLMMTRLPLYKNHCIVHI